MGWDHRALAGAFDARPAEEGLEVVVMAAQAVAVVEAGVVRLAPSLAVVELDALHAGGVAPAMSTPLPPAPR